MIRRKANYYTAAGSLALAIGISSRLWLHGIYADFGGGFLMGVSIALLIFGLVRQKRSVSR